MMDLQVLAFQSDLTRVISFMLSKEQSPRPYPQIGVPEAHHPLSHHNNIPELIERMSKINRYHAQLFSQYLAKLKATPDGDGSLLDHMTILYGAGISNSNGHSGDNLPLMLVGGGAGKIKGGRHLKYRQQALHGKPADDHHGQDGLPGGEGRRQHRQTSHRYACPSVMQECHAMRTVQRLIPLAVLVRSASSAADLGRRRWSTRPKTATKRALRALLQKKVDVNAAEADGSTALHWASYRDDLESADLLIRAGAKVNAATDLGVTPLWPASENGSSAMVEEAAGSGRQSEPARCCRAKRR